MPDQGNDQSVPVFKRSALQAYTVNDIDEDNDFNSEEYLTILRTGEANNNITESVEIVRQPRQKRRCMNVVSNIRCLDPTNCRGTQD